jgi:hypothetical protein
LVCASSRYRYMLYGCDYLNESQLPHIGTRLTIALAIATLVVTLLPVLVISQSTGTIETGFAGALGAVRQAETAGATPNEIASLVALLNKALELNQDALKLTAPSDANKRTELISQVDQTLITVQSQAQDLTTLAAHRSYMNKTLTYIGGILAAFVGTILFAFIVSFYRAYRIKRVFQMRITRK